MAGTAHAASATAWQTIIDSGGSDRGKAICLYTNGDPIVACQYNSVALGDIRVVRLDKTTGAEVWHCDINTGNTDDPNDLYVDPVTGDAYVCGRTTVTGQQLNWVVAKVRGSDGQRMWTYTWNGPANGNDEVRAIGLSADGNVIACGMLTTSLGESQGRIVKINASTGAEIWAYTSGLLWTDMFDIIGDSAGNAIVTGTSGQVTTADGFVIKLSSTGSLVWSKTYNRNGDFDTFTVVTLDSADNVIIGGGARLNGTTATQDFLVLKYLANGTLAWVRLINGTADQSDACYGVTTDAAGDVYATGAIRNAADQSAYIVKLNGANGNTVWSQARNGTFATGNDNFRAVRVVGTSVFTSGQFINANNDIAVAEFDTATGAELNLYSFNSAANAADSIFFKRQMAVIDSNNIFISGDSQNNAIIAKIGPAAPVNSSPTDITLSPAVVNQSAGLNALVGTLSTTDANPGDTFTYSLVAGAGSTDNAAFTISGSTLRAVNPSTLSFGSHSVRIQTDDGHGGTYQEAITVFVNDNIPPQILSVVRKNPLQQTVMTDTVTFNITFSEPVNIAGPQVFNVEPVGNSTINGYVDSISGSGTNYDVAVKILQGRGEFRLVVVGGQAL